MKTLSFVLSTILFSQTTFAGTVKSEALTVNPARIVERNLLVDKEDGTRVQIIEEFIEGATDVSNNRRVILAISKLGEMFSTEASFIVSPSMKLISAKRLSAGIYQITINDADSVNNDGSLKVKKVIDAQNAVFSVQTAKCAEFETCLIDTTVEVK